jgi:hypothetical protein
MNETWGVEFKMIQTKKPKNKNQLVHTSTHCVCGTKQLSQALFYNSLRSTFSPRENPGKHMVRTVSRTLRDLLLKELPAWMKR